MANFLGQSQNAYNFLSPDGQIIQSAPEYLSPDVLSQSVPVPGVQIPLPGVNAPIPNLDQIAAQQEQQQIDSDLQRQALIEASKLNPGEAPIIGDLFSMPKIGQQEQAASDEFGSAEIIPEKPARLVTGGTPLNMPTSFGSGMMGGLPGTEAYSRGIAAEVGAAQKAAKIKQDEYSKLVEQQNLRSADVMARQKEMQSNIDLEMSKYRQMSDEFNKMNSIDPNRMFNNLSTGGKIQAGVAIMLGAIGGALQGTGKNVGLEVINNAIERDIDAQKTELSKKTHSLQSQQNMLGLLKGQLQDDQQAELFFRKIALDNVTNQIAAKTAGLEGTMAYAQGQKALGELEMKKAELTQKIAGNVMQNNVFKLAEQSKGLIPREFEAQLSANEKLGEKIVAISDSSMGIARTPKVAQDLNDATSNAKSLSESINKIKQLRASGLVDRAWVTKNRAALQTLSNSVKLGVKQAEQLGTLDRGSQEVLGEMVGNPENILDINVEAKLDELNNIAKSKLEQQYRSGLIGYKGIEEKKIDKRLNIPEKPSK